MQPTYAPVTLAVTPDPVTEPVTTVSRALRDAALYLTRHGWVQGEYFDTTATVFTPAACMVGAIGMVCYGGPCEGPAQNFDDPGWYDFDAAQGWLDRYLANRYGEHVCAYSFNDADGRTEADVLRALEDAAAAWDRRYGPNGSDPTSTVEVAR